MRPSLFSLDLVNALQEMHLFYSSTSDSGITCAGGPLISSPTPQPHTEPLHISCLGHSNECFTFSLSENQLQIPAEIHWVKRAASVFIRHQLHQGEKVEAEELFSMWQMGTDQSQAKFTPHHNSLLTSRSRAQVVTTQCCNSDIDMERLEDVSHPWR